MCDRDRTPKTTQAEAIYRIDSESATEIEEDARMARTKAVKSARGKARSSRASTDKSGETSSRTERSTKTKSASKPAKPVVVDGNGQHALEPTLTEQTPTRPGPGPGPRGFAEEELIFARQDAEP